MLRRTLRIWAASTEGAAAAASANSSTATSSSTSIPASVSFFTDGLSSQLSSWGNTITGAASGALGSAPLEGIRMPTEQDLRKHMPSAVHPIRRWRYRQYLLSKAARAAATPTASAPAARKASSSMSNSSIKVDNNNNNTDNTNDTVNDDAASSAAPAAASAAAPQQPMATRESQEAMLHRLGLDVRTIVGVAALYAGTFAAFCYYIASSLYLVLCMYAGSSFAPVDPRRKEAATRDSGYSDEFCAIKPSSSSSSSSTANNNSNSSGGIDAASDPETLAARVFAECNDARKVCIIHGPPGSGKSTLLRRVAATVPGSVIFAKVTPRIATSDPIAIVGEHCDEAHPAFVLRLLRRLPAVGDGRRAHRPTLVFDIETPGGAVSSGGSFGDAHARAASSSPGDFNFLKFMEHCKSLACDAGEFNIIVAVDSSVLYSAAPQFARHECFDLARVGELTSEQASRMVAESTDVYAQSLVRESKRTLRFVKDRLAAEMRKAAATDGNGDGDVMAHGRRIVRAERDEMAQAAWSAFARCRDEPAMRLAAAGGRAAVADAAAPVVPLTWAMVEQHCGNRYTSNAQFRDVAEVRESVVTSIGPSAYVPRCDAMRGLIANADADGKKK